MKYLYIVSQFCAVVGLLGTEWHPVEGRISSRWAKEVTPDNAWQEYPRPQFHRSDRVNLNGLWDFSLQDRAAPEPGTFKDKASVLGEYGGIAWPIEEHIWDPAKQYWGYQVFYSAEELEQAFRSMFDQVLDMQRNRGLSAAVYTQISDIEGEMNGLMTYDRERIKIPVESLREIHAQLLRKVNSFPKPWMLFLIAWGAK